MTETAGNRRKEEDTSVLQATQVKIVCRKLRWSGRDRNRCSVCMGLKRDRRVKIQCKHTPHGDRHLCSQIHTRNSGAFSESNMELISHPINVTEDTAYFLCLQRPRRTLGNEHMSYWPQPLDSIMECFIEVKAKSQPVYSKGYWILDLFLGSLTERNKWYSKTKWTVPFSGGKWGWTLATNAVINNLHRSRGCAHKYSLWFLC